MHVMFFFVVTSSKQRQMMLCSFFVVYSLALTVVACSRFALIDFSLKRFLSFFDCFFACWRCLDLSRWTNLAHWPSLVQ